MTALAPAEAYRLWAPVYAEETGVSALDEELASDLSPSPAGLRFLVIPGPCGPRSYCTPDGEAFRKTGGYAKT